VKKAKSLDPKINIITIDFTDDVDSKDDDENLTDVQKKNKKLLHLFTHLCQARVFPSTVAIEIYKQFRAKSVYLVLDVSLDPKMRKI